MHYRVFFMSLFAILCLAGISRGEGNWTEYSGIGGVRTLAIQGEYIWAGTSDGVVKLDTQTGTQVRYTTADGLAGNDINAIAVDKQNAVWFSILDKGVSKFDGSSWRTYTTADGLASNSVYKIAVDAQNDVWFVTNGGVTRFDGSAWRTFTEADGLPGNTPYCITVAPDNTVWVGTLGGGILKFDGSAWQKFVKNPDEPVQEWYSAIAVDSSGKAWIGWMGGVLRFDGSSWTNFSNGDVLTIAVTPQNTVWTGATYGTVRMYDGSQWISILQGEYGSSLHINSIAADSAGEMWFGTSAGLRKYTPPQVPVSVLHAPNHPTSFGIRTASPNPFNPSTTIDFTLSHPGKTTLSVYNTSGQRVETLVDGVMSAGNHRIVWNAHRASGVYLVALESGGMKDTRKVTLIK